MRKELRLFLAIAFLSIVAVFVFASMGALGAQNQNKNNNASPRGECEQQCTQQYQTCRKGPNANQTKCQDELKTCKIACKDVSASPSTPEPTVTATETPTPKN